MTNKIKQAVQFIKKKIEDLKKSNRNNEIKITVNNQDAQKQISQIQKQIDSLQQKIKARQMKLEVITPKLDQITQDTINEYTPEGISPDNLGVQKIVNSKLANNKEYTSLALEEEKMEREIAVYNKALDTAKQKMAELEKNTSQTGSAQNKLTNIFNVFKKKIGEVKEGASNMQKIFGKLSNIAKPIISPVKKIGSLLKDGLGYALKQITTLFSLKNIYSILSNAAGSWLSSQNTQAQQLSANIEYMKYSMGSVFAPVIEYIVNLVYQLMKAIQSVVYAFSGVNIFAKATASSMGKTAGSAKQVNKSLSGVHTDINNVSDSNTSNGGGGITPSIDLSQMDTQMNPIAQKLYDFCKPLKESWDTYGGELIEQVKVTAGQVGGLIESVWGSFENIITNGTVYSILQNILGIIGNIADAFANAWNNNGNGDAIIQNLADALNNVLKIINFIVQSVIFQWLLDIGVEAIKLMTDAIKALTNACVWVIEKIAEFIGFFEGENREKLDAWTIILGSLATAIAVLTGIVVAWNLVSAIAAISTTALGIAIRILTSPITLVILAIAALIAIIVSIIVYWDEISAALSEGWEWIKQKAIEIFTLLSDFFKGLWQGIANIVSSVWNDICNFLSEIWSGIANIASSIWNNIYNFFNGIWNGIANIVNFIWNNICNFLSEIWSRIANIASSIWNNIYNFLNGIWNGIANMASSIWNGIMIIIFNVINAIKNTIQNVLNIISNIWNNIWSGLKNTVTNIFNGIWNAIRTVINWILTGIEKMGNGVVNGINTIIRALNRLSFRMPEWLGGGQFGFNIQTLSTISLPRLAKGGIINSPTIAMMGEYAGVKSNPEIITPQNIMYDTMVEALSNVRLGSNNGQPIRVQIYWGTKAVVDEVIDGINEKTRQTGKAQIKVSYT